MFFLRHCCQTLQDVDYIESLALDKASDDLPVGGRGSSKPELPMMRGQVPRELKSCVHGQRPASELSRNVPSMSRAAIGSYPLRTVASCRVGSYGL